MKSYLLAHDVHAEALHLHFEIAARIGFERYDRVANGWEFGEAIYCALYAPDEAGAILERTLDVLTRAGEADLALWARSGNALADVERATLDVVDGLDLSRYRLIGFSVGALQLGASLYLARLFKERAPHLQIVLGGGGVLGDPGANLLRTVPWIDAIVDGEGETALLELARLDKWVPVSLAGVPNVRYRDPDGSIAKGPLSVLPDLGSDRYPDMDEFYEAARKADYPRTGLVLPLEASRGCAWEHRRGDGRLRGCTFCGLYRNSPNARRKELSSLLGELHQGIARSQVLELSFVDAYLPTYAKDLLRCLATDTPDVTLFCEARCDLDEEMAELLARAGTRRLQLGVEAFDTGILTKMEKGVRAIDNISSIKLCEEFGVPFQYNIMLRVPGVSAAELETSMKLLPLLHGYRPPSLTEFYLDRGSRMYADPQSFGISPDSLDREPLCFLPAALGRACVYQVVPFEADMDNDTRAGWNGIEQAVKGWRDHYGQLVTEGIRLPLSYRDGGEFVTVVDYRRDEPQLITLAEQPREVFLACDRLTTKSELSRRFPDLGSASLQRILDHLQELDVLIQEGAQVLSLPIRARLPNGSPRKWGRHG